MSCTFAIESFFVFGIESILFIKVSEPISVFIGISISSALHEENTAEKAIAVMHRNAVFWTVLKLILVQRGLICIMFY